jgi:zinc protease
MLPTLRHRAYVTFATALCVLSISTLPSADQKKSSGQSNAPLALPLGIQRVTLDNGLRVVMNVDHASPTVAVAVTYDVGSRDEEPGKTGFAHTFEHLMFGATKNLNEGQFEALVVGRGGFLTAITAVDRTAYYMVIPENELSLGLWLEAERMRFIDVSAASFEAERKVIEEEHRLRVANMPYGRAYWRTSELAFDGCFAYGHAPPGAPEDLARAELAWVRAFHAAHYGPNTAVLSLSGDFDPDAAMTLVHRYFDNIPRIQAKPFSEPTIPEPRAERREVIQDPLARVSALSYGFVMPKPLTREHDALRFAAVILGDGERARLPALLVREKALATMATASVDDYNYATGPGLLRMEVRLVQDVTTAEVEKHVDAVLSDLATRPPSPEEMLRARRRLETALALHLAWTRNRAIELGKYEVSFGDARLLTRAFDRFAAITADDVQNAVAKYLDKNRRAVIESRPAPAKPEGDAKTARGEAP